MHCRDCARYDEENRKCKDGKVNPLRWETAVEVANVLGLRSICVFNDHREKLIRARSSGTPSPRCVVRGEGAGGGESLVPTTSSDQ